MAGSVTVSETKPISHANNVKNNNNNNNVMEEEECFVRALQVIQSGGLPMVLKAASELDLFGIMARAGGGRHLSAKEIAAQLPSSKEGSGGARNPDAPSMLDRMLRLLATHSIVSCSVAPTGEDGGLERRYGLAPLSELFVPGESGVSLGPFLALVEDEVVRAHWSKLKDAVLEGGVPFKMAHDGVAGFDYPSMDPRFNDVLNKAMFNYTTIIVQMILQKYDGFEGIKLLVDVGGGLGHTLNAIVTKHPSIRGINYDLPHVVSHAKPYPGIEHIGGDMFKSVPKGDAIMMKGILHDWTDEHCLKLLKNCYEALPENGKVIALELLLTEEPDTTVLAKAISQFDIYLMNIGGKERTEKEFLALANASGFSSIKLQCRVGQYWVMEFHK